MLVDNFTEDKFIQCSKVSQPISVTLFGMLISRKFVQYENAHLFISRSEFGNITDINLD